MQAGAHEHQFFCEAGEFRIERNGQREIGHGAALVNRYFVRKLVHHADHEMSGIFVAGLGVGLAFRHVSKIVGWMIQLRSPCSQPGN